jgi:xylulose-5-phosphate/fructose-6-phosphate phosphoketolase
MNSVGIAEIERIKKRIRKCDYLCVAQLFLQDNFLLERPLVFDDVKARLLGHWGTCHGINVAYATLQSVYGSDSEFRFVLGPGHGYPALNANLWLDGELNKVDPKATVDLEGLKYLCRQFSWPDGFPSHASPLTPGVITEGGELGYALANAYGLSLGHPEKTTAVLIGDGELETATALDSLNLRDLLAGSNNGKVLPILHLNGYKISAPSIYARKSERELHELIRGFGFTVIDVDGEDTETFLRVLREPVEAPFYILRTEKGFGGPNRHHEAHQIPLKNPKTDEEELAKLEEWLKSYHPESLFEEGDGSDSSEREQRKIEVGEDHHDEKAGSDKNSSGVEWVDRLRRILK